MAVRKRAAKKTMAAVKPVAEKAAEAPAAKAEEKAEEKAAEVKPAEKAEEKAVAVKPAEKAEEKAATVKAAEKPAAEKKATRKAPVKKAPAKKAELKSSICVQFGGKSYSQEDLIKIARDVWKYDLKQKVGSLESVELYVKPEENMVYYVMNKDFTGSFYI